MVDAARRPGPMGVAGPLAFVLILVLAGCTAPQASDPEGGSNGEDGAGTGSSAPGGGNGGTGNAGGTGGSSGPGSGGSDDGPTDAAGNPCIPPFGWTTAPDCTVPEVDPRDRAIAEGKAASPTTAGTPGGQPVPSVGAVASATAAAALPPAPPIPLAACATGNPLGTPYGGGTGAPSDPHLVFNEGQLRNIDLDPTKSYALCQNIAITAPWTPLAGFSGQFQGSLYHITGLVVTTPLPRPVSTATPTPPCFAASSSASTPGYAGLFSAIYTSAQVRDLYIDGASVAVGAADAAGILAGCTYQAYISLIMATGTVNGPGNALGGLVGIVYATEIVLSTTDVQVTGNAQVGGLVGDSWYGNIFWASSHGTVTGGSDTGGLVGRQLGGPSTPGLYHTYATGSVGSTGNPTTYATTGHGGLVGQNHWYIDASYSLGGHWYCLPFVNYNLFGFGPGQVWTTGAHWVPDDDAQNTIGNAGADLGWSLLAATGAPKFIDLNADGDLDVNEPAYVDMDSSGTVTDNDVIQSGPLFGGLAGFCDPNLGQPLVPGIGYCYLDDNADAFPNTGEPWYLGASCLNAGSPSAVGLGNVRVGNPRYGAALGSWVAAVDSDFHMPLAASTFLVRFVDTDITGTWTRSDLLYLTQGNMVGPSDLRLSRSVDSLTRSVFTGFHVGQSAPNLHALDTAAAQALSNYPAFGNSFWQDSVAWPYHPLLTPCHTWESTHVGC